MNNTQESEDTTTARHRTGITQTMRLALLAGLLVTAGCAYLPGGGEADDEGGAQQTVDWSQEASEKEMAEQDQKQMADAGEQADTEQQQAQQQADQAQEDAEAAAGKQAQDEQQDQTPEQMAEEGEAGADAQKDMTDEEQKTAEQTQKMQEKKDQPVEINSWLRVSNFKFSYTDPKAAYPSVKKIVADPVELGVHEKGYTAPDQVEEGNTEKVDITQEFGEEQGKFTARAVRVISARLLQRLKGFGYMGVLVSPHPDDVNKGGEDVRPEARTSLRIVFHIARVDSVRTIARGERLVGEDKEKIVNHPAHKWIKAQSPVEGGKGEVMKRQQLTDYVNRLNRHPGRRVDLSVSGAGKQGEAVLDYRVTEGKPWTAYLQISDTGTESSGQVQTRAGFVHNQLTGRDDTLSLSYVASGLDDEIKDEDDDGDFSPQFQAGTVSYETPVFAPGSRTTFELVGKWDRFTSEDVGLRGLDFEGQGWSVGGTFRHNLLQFDDYFIDGYAGVVGKRETTDNIVGPSGRESFVIPEVGFEGETSSQTTSSSWQLGARWNLDEVAGTERGELQRLGRTGGADPSWAMATLNGTHSMYLEPLLYGEEWRDPSTPESSTLAHELKVSARGQYTSDRVNPSELFVNGGMYTVRGYPESAVSADRGYSTSVAYRLHLPRLLPVQDPGTIPLTNTDFRTHPENVFGMPDWDWVLKGFFDYGYVNNEDHISGVEADHETLMSAGIGTELQLMEYLRFRIDWGWALRDLDGPNSPDVERGDSEAHMLFTVTY